MARRALLALLLLLGLGIWVTRSLGAETLCAIQGRGGASPLVGARVTASGVVTADFRSTELGGFFVQDPVCDVDAATSDAVFVRAPAAAGSVTVGHRVTLSGRVVEHFGMTALELEGVTDDGRFAGGLEAVALAPPADAEEAEAYLEAREGMLVSLALSRVVGATNSFGESYLVPDASGVRRLFAGEPDGRRLGLGAPHGWLALDHGDRVRDAGGVLAFSFGNFKVLLPAGRTPAVERANLTPATAPDPAGALTLGSYNLENLFDAVDDPGRDDPVPSAAEYQAALARRARSIAERLRLPDVLGVQEVESLGVLQDLAAQPELAAAGYQAALVEGEDPRGIDVGLLYRSDRMRLLSSEARQGCTDLPAASGPCTLSGGGALSLFSRPPLVVRIEIAASGERLILIVNHFKSKRGDAAETAALRLAQAEFVAGLAEEIAATEPAAGIVVLGDLNDGAATPPLARLTRSGRLVDVAARGGERPYSFVFQGLSEQLDHVLVDARLAPRVLGAGPVHANVDFAVPGPGETSPRVSDHDPLLLRLR